MRFVKAQPGYGQWPCRENQRQRVPSYRNAAHDIPIQRAVQWKWLQRLSLYQRTFCDKRLREIGNCESIITPGTAVFCEHLLERFFDRLEPCRQLDGLVGVAAGKIQLALMIFHFHFDKL